MPRISCDAAWHSSFSSRNKQPLAIIRGLSYVRECVWWTSSFYLRRPRLVPGRTCHHFVPRRLFLLVECTRSFHHHSIELNNFLCKLHLLSPAPAPDKISPLFAWWKLVCYLPFSIGNGRSFSYQHLPLSLWPTCTFLQLHGLSKSDTRDLSLKWRYGAAHSELLRLFGEVSFPTHGLSVVSEHSESNETKTKRNQMNLLRVVQF